MDSIFTSYGSNKAWSLGHFSGGRREFATLQWCIEDRSGDDWSYLTEMCSDSEAGSYLRRIDYVYHSTLGLRVIMKKRDWSRLSGLVEARNLFSLWGLGFGVWGVGFGV